MGLFNKNEPKLKKNDRFEYVIQDICHFSDGARITEYRNRASEIVIPEKIDGLIVWSVGSAFYKSKDILESITLPNTLEEIGLAAFEDCVKLKSIKIPKGIKEIEYHTFVGCKSLTEVTIPESVEKIGECAFAGCESLKSVVIPQGVTIIERNTFEKCCGLTSLKIPQSVVEINDSAFSKSNIVTITIPKTVTKIGKGTFYGCKCLKSITFPEHLKDDITNALKKDENEGMFFGVYIGQEEFTPSEIEFVVASCDEWEVSFNEMGSFERYCRYIYNEDIGGIEVLGLKEDTDTLEIPAYTDGKPIKRIAEKAFISRKCLKSVTIPDSLSEIGNAAFCECVFLASVTFSNKTKEADENKNMRIGKEAFCRCESLKNITIPNSVTEIGIGAFSLCKNLNSVTLSNRIKEINDRTFYICYNLKNIVIPDSVTYIGNNAFHYSLITSITIPNSVTALGPIAFGGCKFIKEIVIPDSVVLFVPLSGGFSNRCFGGCESLQQITVPAHFDYDVVMDILPDYYGLQKEGNENVRIDKVKVIHGDNVYTGMQIMEYQRKIAEKNEAVRQAEMKKKFDTMIKVAKAVINVGATFVPGGTIIKGVVNAGAALYEMNSNSGSVESDYTDYVTDYEDEDGEYESVSVQEAAPPVVKETVQIKESVQQIANTSIDDVADMLKKLKGLNEAGILTDDEFAEKKAELLTRI